MFFRKKRRMIDVRELQKRGVVRIPKKDLVIPTNSDGFVELGKKSSTVSEENQNNTQFFGFSEASNTGSHTGTSFATSSEGYNKREVDEKITDLDNKIYKLEQRIELLEKKLDINTSSTGNSGVLGAMGW